MPSVVEKCSYKLGLSLRPKGSLVLPLLTAEARKALAATAEICAGSETHIPANTGMQGATPNLHHTLPQIPAGPRGKE